MSILILQKIKAFFGQRVKKNMTIIDGVIVTPLNIVNVNEGNVLHGIKSTDNGFKGFGEAYFSTIEFGKVKAWKRHRMMTLNLIVPIGEISFVIHDDRVGSITSGMFQNIKLSKQNYARLTIPPMLWLGFQGVGNEENILLNIANIEHNPEEADKKNLDDFIYDWRL
jgi:dTDP-4-dehydrorhamnose 3,5-epimerase